MATELGWGATRAWRAEAKLRAAGLVRMERLGRAHPKQATVVRGAARAEAWAIVKGAGDVV